MFLCLLAPLSELPLLIFRQLCALMLYMCISSAKMSLWSHLCALAFYKFSLLWHQYNIHTGWVQLRTPIMSCGNITHFLFPCDLAKIHRSLFLFCDLSLFQWWYFDIMTLLPAYSALWLTYHDLKVCSFSVLLFYLFELKYWSRSANSSQLNRPLPDMPSNAISMKSVAMAALMWCQGVIPYIVLIASVECHLCSVNHSVVESICCVYTWLSLPLTLLLMSSKVQSSLQSKSLETNLFCWMLHWALYEQTLAPGFCPQIIQTFMTFLWMYKVLHSLRQN